MLAKVLRDGARGSLLLPVWPTCWWWRRLCPDGRHFAAYVTDWLELTKTLFARGDGDGLWNHSVLRNRMVVVRLDDRPGGKGIGPSLGFCSSDACGLCAQAKPILCWK